ncbi:MAG: hypothetical protein AAF533_04615 [Acidobacteriota bacterium]
MSKPRARREDLLRLSGSVGSNRAMGREYSTLTRRSRFELNLGKPGRQGSSNLLFPFDARAAWVAACYHRSCSAVGWEIASSPASRLEPLHEQLVELLSRDERLDTWGEVRLSVNVRRVEDFEAGPLQLRGAVKNALLEAFRRRGRRAVMDADEPNLRFLVRRTGLENDRRTWLSLDLGGPSRHLRHQRAAVVEAPIRETLAAQFVLLSGWDPRSEIFVDPMAGGGTIPMEAAHLAFATAVRTPAQLTWPASLLKGLPEHAPPLFPDSDPRILSLDVEPARVKAMIGNLRVAGLTGKKSDVITVGNADLRELDPDRVISMVGEGTELGRGVFCFDPPQGVRTGGSPSEIRDLHRACGRALRQFRGWRSVIFLTQDDFIPLWARPTSSRPAASGNLRGKVHLFEY